MVMALEGIRIVEMTIYQHGPVAGAMLADMGAEVIKVEEPVSGDPGRYLSSWNFEGIAREGIPLNYYWENNNRNKKSLGIDLKNPDGKEAMYRLLEKSDVFISNFREPSLVKLGMDYETIHKLNPKLVYAIGYGFGPNGPDANRPSADLAAQARGGIMSQHLSNGPLQIWGGQADQTGAFMLALGVAIALVARERTGVGQKVEESLLGSQLALGALNVQGYLFSGRNPAEYGQLLVGPFWNVYRCKDDRWLALAVLDMPRHWHPVCDVLELDGVSEDPRFQTDEDRLGPHRVELIHILQEAFAKKPRDEWTEKLNATDILWAPVQTYEEALSDPQTVANDYVAEIEHPNVGPIKMLGLPIKLSENPGKVRSPAPELGQHTEEILTEILDYSWDDVTAMRKKGVF